MNAITFSDLSEEITIEELKEVLVGTGVNFYLKGAKKQLLLKGDVVVCQRDFLALNDDGEIDIRLYFYSDSILLKIHNRATEITTEIQLPLPKDYEYISPYLRLSF